MNYHGITKDDIVNGTGLRVVLWVSGCEHRCTGCHNSHTWDLNGGKPFDDEAFDKIFEYLDSAISSGITFSGGDPLHPNNREDVTALAKYLKKKFPGKTIWVYTGYMYEDIQSLEIMQHIDVLVDGRFEQSLKTLNVPWVGSSNQRVIDVQETRKCGKVVLFENFL